MLIVKFSYVGYKPNVCSEFQNEKVQNSIKYLIAPLPLLFLVLSSVSIYFYPIDSKKAEENSKIIRTIHR